MSAVVRTVPVGSDRIMSVLSATQATPPASPADGDTYAVPAGATGAWAGLGACAVRWSSVAGAWRPAFYSPWREGAPVVHVLPESCVRAADNGLYYCPANLLSAPTWTPVPDVADIESDGPGGGGGAASATGAKPDPFGRFFGRSGITSINGNSSIAGEPFVVRDGATWRMFYFRVVSGALRCYTATASYAEGPWTGETQLANLNGYHKMALLVDEDGNPVQVGGNYYAYVVSYNGTLTGKDIYVASCATLGGTWALGSAVITRGASGEPDEANCDAPYALYKDGAVHLWYMAHPNSSHGTYGYAQRLRYASASSPAGAFTKGSIVLNPSTTAGQWDYGWIGGAQVLKRPNGTYLMIYGAGGPRPGSVGAEATPCHFGFATSPGLANGGTWTKDDTGNPYSWLTGLPSGSIETQAIWRPNLVYDDRARDWLVYYNTGGSGVEHITFARAGVLDYQISPTSNLQTVTTSEADVAATRLELPPGRYRVTYTANLGYLDTHTGTMVMDWKLKLDGVTKNSTKTFMKNYAYENHDTVAQALLSVPSRGVVKATVQITEGTANNAGAAVVRNLRVMVEQLAPR